MASVGRSGEIFLSRAAAVRGFGDFILHQLQQNSKFAQEAFVFVVRPDPEPDQIVIQLPGQSAVATTNTHRPYPSCKTARLVKRPVMAFASLACK